MNLLPINCSVLLLNIVAMFLTLMEKTSVVDGARLMPSDFEDPECNCGEHQQCLPRAWSEQISLDETTCVDNDRICQHLFGKYSQGKKKYMSYK